MAKSLTRGEIESQARSALAESPVLELRKLRVEQDGDVLLISGRVVSYYHSQLAQEAVRAVVGDTKVVNSIDVA